ncbi:MAG: GNAT family N-acetyltransferase [Sphingobium sp.]
MDSDNRPPNEVTTTLVSPAADHGFLRPAWFDMLARHCFAGHRLLMERVDLNGASVILPLVDDGDRLSALANYYSFSYGPMFNGTEDPGRRIALLRELAVDLRKSYRRISLYPLLDDDGTAQMLQRAFRSAGWIALLTDQNSNHYLNVDGRDFAAYWARRPGALRSSVRRKSSRSRAYEFAIHPMIDDELWNDYRAVYGASWKNAEPYPAMVRAIAEEAMSRGALRLAFLRREGVPVAAQIWTIEGDTACIHKIAHDSAEDSGSPGTLLSCHMFEHMIDREKVAHIDYGTGGNAYKGNWMERQRPMLRLDCFDPRRATTWIPAVRTRISQLVGRPS